MASDRVKRFKGTFVGSGDSSSSSSSSGGGSKAPALGVNPITGRVVPGGKAPIPAQKTTKSPTFRRVARLLIEGKGSLSRQEAARIGISLNAVKEVRLKRQAIAQMIARRTQLAEGTSKARATRLRIQKTIPSKDIHEVGSRKRRDVSLDVILPQLNVPLPKKEERTVRGTLRKAEIKFSRELNQRRQNAAEVSRLLSRKQQEGKKLTKNERAALVSVGLTNVGIESLDAITFPFRRPKELAIGVVMGLSALVTDPVGSWRAIRKEVARNPAGFIAAIIGTHGAFSVAGRLLKGVAVVGKTTVGTIGKGVTAGIKVTKLLQKGKVTFKIVKAAKNKFKTNLIITTPSGKVVYNANRFSRLLRLKKGIGTVKDFVKLQNEFNTAASVVKSLKKITLGQKNVPRSLLKQILKLEQKADKLGKLVIKNAKARGKIVSVQVQAQIKSSLAAIKRRAASLKRFRDYHTKIRKPILKKGKLSRKAKRREAQREARAKQRREKFGKSPHEIRQSGREAVKRFDRQARKLLEKSKGKGQYKFNEIMQRVAIIEKMKQLQLARLKGGGKPLADTVGKFFKLIDKQNMKLFKKMRGCK